MHARRARLKAARCNADHPDSAAIAETLAVLDEQGQPCGIVHRHSLSDALLKPFATDLFAAATVARMAQHWQTVLHAMVASAGSRPAQLTLLADGEQRPHAELAHLLLAKHLDVDAEPRKGRPMDGH